MLLQAGWFPAPDGRFGSTGGGAMSQHLRRVPGLRGPDGLRRRRFPVGPRLGCGGLPADRVLHPHGPTPGGRTGGRREGRGRGVSVLGGTGRCEEQRFRCVKIQNTGGGGGGMLGGGGGAGEWWFHLDFPYTPNATSAPSKNTSKDKQTTANASTNHKSQTGELISANEG